MTTRDLAAATTDLASPTIVPAPFAPGMVIAERYRLEAQLGAGGGGTVWRCFDQKLETIVALKIVSADGDLERWRREVAMARRIASPNVCRVHDLGETGNVRFVTMELVEGDSLRHRISPALTQTSARDLFTQLVSGVAAIHAAGVVHRDLKPENVVVDHDGRVVIVDFGLAREPRIAANVAPALAGSPREEAATVTVELRGPSDRIVKTPASSDPISETVTHAGTIVGTPRYMSPEQAAGLAVDARIDVWALGLIGHELLAGAMPEHDENSRRVAPGVEIKWPGITSVLRKCLALVPDQRFTDARELAAAIAALGGRRRVRVMIAAAALAALLAGALGVRALVQSDRPQVIGEPHQAATKLRLEKLPVTGPQEWPQNTPVSVALAPDGATFAYTTGDAGLLVRTSASAPPIQWSIPDLKLVSTWAVGWFGDGSIALLGTERDSGFVLYRVYSTGRTQLLYRNPERFTAAVTPLDDRVVIGISNYALFVIPPGEHVEPLQIARLERDEAVTAVAWSPDASRIAYTRSTDRDRTSSLQVMSSAGESSKEIWRGDILEFVDPLLAWVDNERVVFAREEANTHRTQLVIRHVTTGAEQTTDWAETITGLGSAANGVLLVLRGTLSHAVQIGDDSARKLERLHDRNVRASRIAGWTNDRRVVFAAGLPGKEQIVRAAPGQALESWPGTTAGVEYPDTMVGDDLLVHRMDDVTAQIVVERITATGQHSEVTRIAGPAGLDLVRCAGDRTTPCIIEETRNGIVSVNELDPLTGALGPRIHQRPVRPRSPANIAVSQDGRFVAVVDGAHEVTTIERATGTERRISAGEGSVLQSVVFAPSGDLWITALGYDGRRYGVLSLSMRKNGQLSSFPLTKGHSKDTLRWFWRPSTSPDGTQIAVATRELVLDIWRVDGL